MIKAYSQGKKAYKQLILAREEHFSAPSSPPDLHVIEKKKSYTSGKALVKVTVRDTGLLRHRDLIIRL